MRREEEEEKFGEIKGASNGGTTIKVVLPRIRVLSDLTKLDVRGTKRSRVSRRIGRVAQSPVSRFPQ